jgi:hypothetical protein
MSRLDREPVRSVGCSFDVPDALGSSDGDGSGVSGMEIIWRRQRSVRRNRRRQFEWILREEDKYSVVRHDSMFRPTSAPPGSVNERPVAESGDAIGQAAD